MKASSPAQMSFTIVMEIILLLITIALGYCILYGPQVVVTLWAKHYQLSPRQASLLVIVILAPMCIAPLTYGYFLGSGSTRKIILISGMMLSIASAVLGYVDHPTGIILARLGQGLALPALMTGMMSRLSELGTRYQLPLIAYYLTATVIGGLLGRLVTGYLASIWPLHKVWSMWAILIAISLSFFWILGEYSTVPINRAGVGRHQLLNALRTPSVLPILTAASLMFGVFAAVLNLLPFRMVASSTAGSLAIAHQYWGYLLGAVLILFANRIDQWLGGRGYTAGLGLIMMSVGICIGLVDRDYSHAIFVMVLILCLGMFTTHPLLADYMTRVRPELRGVMSGLYVSSYYLGGLILSWLSSVIYEEIGWTPTLLLLATCSLIGGGICLSIARDLKWDHRSI